MQEVEEVQKSVPVITYERHLSAKGAANRASWQHNFHYTFV